MQESSPGDIRHAGLIAYPKGPFNATFRFLVLPNQAMLLFLPVPGLVANGLHVLLILTADALHLPGHGHDHFQACSCFVASEVGSHLDEDDCLQTHSHQSARYKLLHTHACSKAAFISTGRVTLRSSDMCICNYTCRARYSPRSIQLMQSFAALLQHCSEGAASYAAVHQAKTDNQSAYVPFSTLLVVSLSSSMVVYTLKGGRKSYVLLQTS